MKKLHILALSALIFTHIDANNTTSHTFFSIRPQYMGAMPEKIALMEDRYLAKKDGIKGDFQMVPFGGSSVNGCEIGKFFMPFNKSCLVVGEFGSEAVKNGTVDVIANYFGVFTRPVDEVFAGAAGFMTENLTYESLISFNPKQTVYGLGLTYRQKVNQRQDKDIWIQVSSPIMGVRNDLGYREKIINPGGGALGVEVSPGYVATIGDALRGATVFGDKQFYFGKISDCPRTRWGLADIEFTVGFETKNCTEFERWWYFGCIIPTGNKPNGEYIFEPIVGNNGHFGLILGGGYSYEFWKNQCETVKIWFLSHGHSYYLFSNTQRRSVDLMDKQWGRYIWMYTGQQQTVAPSDINPGINQTTLNVSVEPRSSFNGNMCLQLAVGNFLSEVGYNTYYRQAEEVQLTSSFREGPAIVGIDEANTTVQLTKSNSSIAHNLMSQGIAPDINFDGSLKYVRIHERDLNLASAAHPCVVAHIFYGALGYRFDDQMVPTLIGIGGSYESSADNVGLHRWLAWFNVSVSF